MPHLSPLFEVKAQSETDGAARFPNPPNPPSPPLKSITAASHTALIVANESLVTFLRRCFDEEGYTVRIASNTNEGLRLYRDFGPFNVVVIEYDAPNCDAVKIDCLLPQTNGRNLATDILHISSAQGIIFAAPAYRTPADLALPQQLIHIPVLIDISIFQLRTLISTLELRRAIEALTVADKLRLKRSADFWVGVRGLTPQRTAEDLLAEAQLKTLTRERQWKRDFTLVQHLRESMKSISHNWAKKREHKETYLFSEISNPNPDGKELSPIDTLESDQPTADRSVEGRSEVAQIFKLFTDDREATQVLQGWLDELKPNEIRKKYGFDEKRFGAAKKRIRMTIMSRGNHNHGS